MSKNKDFKIIGITGSYGKTTTIKIVNEYLKAKGKRSVLFASCGIDLPNSNYDKDDEIEVPIYNEKSLNKAINGARNCNADYLLLEINERTIAKGYVKNVPFYIRALTNIVPLHNTFEYSKEEYVKIKESFFENIKDEDECTCIYGEVGKEYLDVLMSANNKPKKIATSRYIASVKGLKEEDVNYLLYQNENAIFDSLDGLLFNVKTKDNKFKINTKLIMPHNALNINIALAIIDTLDELDIDLFNKVLNEITILGRDEVIKEKGRTIITSITCAPHLEILKKYQNNGLINNIILVTGSYGSGFESWDKEYNSERYSRYVNDSMKFIYKYIVKNVNKVYITSVDNASSDPKQLINNQVKEIEGKTCYFDVLDRREAIRKAILESENGDVIFISGRGNRAIFCKSRNEIDYYKDMDIVRDALNDLKE